MIICSLCLQEKKLENSHLIPKSIYKAVRNAYSNENGGGIVFGRSKSNSMNYTDYQVTSYLLCAECEKRFSQGGENEVTPECYRGITKFRLRKKIKLETPIFNVKGENWYIPKLGEINTSAYMYFALSVFWRASVGDWQDKGVNEYKYALGDYYQEKIRLYLLGEALPENLFLAVYVDSDNDSNIVPFTSFPSVNKKRNYYHHIFNIPGVKFSLLVGKKPKGVYEMAQNFNSKIFFIEYSFREHPDFQQLVYNVKTVKARGRLASDDKRR